MRKISRFHYLSINPFKDPKGLELFSDLDKLHL